MKVTRKIEFEIPLTIEEFSELPIKEMNKFMSSLGNIYRDVGLRTKGDPTFGEFKTILRESIKCDDPQKELEVGDILDATPEQIEILNDIAGDLPDGAYFSRLAEMMLG